MKPPRSTIGMSMAASTMGVSLVVWLATVGMGPAAVETRDDPARASATPDQDSEPSSGSRAAIPMIANPLWAIPLKSLTATRERPIFLPSRRPPAPAVVGAAYVEPPKPAPVSASEPEQPPLTLVGIVIGTADGIAVFVNQATRDIIRLRTGEGHDGWVLRSVSGREAVLEKNRRTAVIALPVPAGDQK